MLFEPNVQAYPPDPGTELATSAMVRSPRVVALHLFADMALDRIKVRKPRARMSESVGSERLLGPENCPDDAKPLKEGTSLMMMDRP